MLLSWLTDMHPALVTFAEEIDGGVAEKVTVAGERQIPVEEILRRLQAFEDAQARRLDHYQGVNTTKLRFQAASGVSAIEATFEGSFFARDGQATDWMSSPPTRLFCWTR